MPAVDFALGKRPGTVEDRRTFKVASLLTDEAPVPKRWRIARDLPKRREGRGETAWPMYMNNRYGCCGLASGFGHRVLAQEFSAGQNEPLGPPTDDQVLSAYSQVSGFDPISGANDNGVYLIDVLRLMRSQGFGQEADGSRHTISAYAKVDLPESYEDGEHLRRAAKVFGGLYLGLALPITAAHELDGGRPWATVAGPGSKPYSWGGHAVYLVEYTEKYLTCVTWAQEQQMTWQWFATYCDEAWAIVSEDFLRRGGKSPQGFNEAALQEQLAKL